jgi:aminoglycoside phosphotransferase (APT) family kinase protein
MAVDGFALDQATADAVLRLVDRRLRAETVAKLDGGTNSAVFEVRARDGRAVVVKVYSDRLHWKLEKEVFVYGLLDGVDLAAPVPAVLAADESKALLPQNVLVLTRLDGVPVSSLVDRLSDRELARITRQIGAFLRSLHELGFDAFGYVGTDGIVRAHDTNLRYMRFQFDKKLREFAELGGDDALRRRIERHVDRREELLAGCRRAVYCHNDVNYGNVLVADDGSGRRMSGMLDFENVLAGDPLLDLAKAHCYSSRRNERLLAALVGGYGDVRDGWREALDLYVLYHWLELWDWFASLGETAPLDGLAREMRLLAT